jgi:hypothetical protein
VADGTVVYPPAYQQVLKGLPAVDYAARDIIYRPRNVRAHRVYGFSPVQQVLMTVNIALRRQLWQLDYFTEGSIPDALIGVPQSWTPDQIRQFQDYWDTEFAGDLARRRRAKFVPGESAAKVVQTKEPQHKDDFDEWLARIICYAFSVPPQWAAKVMNRATAENQSAQAEEEGLEPTKEWVKDLIDEILADEFASPDLELHWLDEDKDDPEALLESRLKVGAVTLNEMRDALGLDPYDNAAADRPMVLTPTGYVPIEANAGGEGANAGNASVNGSSANAETQSAEPALGKARADDPKHPGWSAGTPGGRGGKFRPKDADGGETSTISFSEGSPQSRVQAAPPEIQTQAEATAGTGQQLSGDHQFRQRTASGNVQLVNDIPPRVGLGASLRRLVELGHLTEEEAAAIERNSNAMAAFDKARLMTAIEDITVREARSVLASEEFAQIRAAYLAGQGTVVRIGGRTIQYEPAMPPNYPAMTDFQGNGFAMGPGAFTTPLETEKTVLHELYRLNTTMAGVPGAENSAASALVEGKAAGDFVDRIIKSGVMDRWLNRQARNPGAGLRR